MNKFKRLAYQPYKWLVFLPAFLIISLIAFPLMIVAGFATGRTNDISNKYLPFLWSYLTLKLALCKITVRGKENIDKDAPYVFVMNHTSNLDSPISCLPFKKITWAMKHSLKNIPIFGTACVATGSIFIDRSNPEAARQSIVDAKERILRDKLSIFFCPEGTRSVDGKIKPFKKGAFVMAEDLGLPVVPMTVRGAFEALPTGGFNLFPQEIILTIHKPLDPKIGSAKLLEESYKIIESDLNGK